MKDVLTKNSKSLIMNKEINMTISDLTGNELTFDGCMGCKIARGTIKPFGDILYEDENFYVCQDMEVPINGFLIVSSKEHYYSINEFSDEMKINFILLVDKVLKTLKEIGVAEEFILLQGERKDIHFHTSLFPRNDWMKKQFGRVVSNLKNIQEYAKNNLKTPENLSKIAKTCEILKKELNKK